MPRKPLFLVGVFGFLLALLGTLLLFSSFGSWIQLFSGSLLLCLSVLVFFYAFWLWRTPIFQVDAQGFRTRYLANHVRITWEEIEEISDHYIMRGMPLSGVCIKKRRDTTLPQEVFIPEGSFSLTTEQLLIQIRRQFHTQLERYTIAVHHKANHA